MSTEKGIYKGKNEGSFEDEKSVKRRLILEGKFPEIHEKDFEKRKSVSFWTRRAEKRSEDLGETTGNLDEVLRVNLPDNPIICTMGDVHFGNPKTIYKRIEEEVTAIKNCPRASVILGGDLVDGFFWGGATQSEQSANIEEQYRFLGTLFDELKGRVIVAVSGEHDSKWASKTGIDPYVIMGEHSNIPYIRGVAEVAINTGKQRYDFVIAHKLRGHSVYNATHPQIRAGRELQGADVYCGFHNHTKGSSQQPIRSFGESRVVTYIASGAYKRSDDYSERNGYARQDLKQLFGHALLLDSKNKDITINNDVLEGIRRWG